MAPRRGRTRPQPGAAARRGGSASAARRAAAGTPPSRGDGREADRLPTPLAPHARVGLALAGIAGAASIAGVLDGFALYEDVPAVPITLAALGITGAFLVERDAVLARPRRALRCAAIGLVVVALVALARALALTPASVVAALAAHRLGPGSVAAPAAVAAVGSVGVTGQPAFALVVAMGMIWPGLAVLLLGRSRGAAGTGARGR